MAQQNPSLPEPAVLADLLPDVVLQTDGQWRLTYLNPAWQRLTGHGRDATLGRSLFDFVHPEDHLTLKSGVSAFRLRYAFTDYGWVHLRLHVHSDATGQVVSRQGVLTELAQAAEQPLIEDRLRYLRLLETIDGVVWEAERGVGNTFLSPQVERLFGYSVDEWRADPNFWRNHLHPDDFAQALAIDEAAYSATHSHAYEMNYRFFAQGGKVVWVRDLCRVLVEPGQPTRMIGLMIDVSQAKRVQLELQQSQTRYALAAQGANDGVWDWDLQRNVLHVSQRFNDMLGLSQAALVHSDAAQFFDALMDPDDRRRAQQAYQRHLAGETQQLAVDFRARHSNGSLLWVSWRGLAHFEAGTPVRMAGSLTDLAQRGSSYDTLTKLPGRPLFRDRLEHAMAVQRRADASVLSTAVMGETIQFAVLLLDLDRFKAVNDQLGHHAGDALLQQVARRLERSVRQSDLVARMGGDEFVVLLEAVDVPRAMDRAQHIAKALAAPVWLEPHSVQTGASIGVVSSKHAFTSADEYLRAADQAMYQAKNAGGGVVLFAPAATAT
jgi:diguanylate cyclase (GGDEF)-like protein/PAS domain S-box-containing protein